MFNLLNVDDTTISGTYVQINSLTFEPQSKVFTIVNKADKKVRIQIDNEENGSYIRQVDFDPNSKTLIILNTNEKIGRIRGNDIFGWVPNEASLIEFKSSVMILENDCTSQKIDAIEGIINIEV